MLCADLHASRAELGKRRSPSAGRRKTHQSACHAPVCVPPRQPKPAVQTCSAGAVQPWLTRPYACPPLESLRFSSRSRGKDSCECAANPASSQSERSVVVHAEKASYLEVREVEKESPNNHDNYTADLQRRLKRDQRSLVQPLAAVPHCTCDLATLRGCTPIYKRTPEWATHARYVATPEEDPSAFLYIESDKTKQRRALILDILLYNSKLLGKIQKKIPIQPEICFTARASDAIYKVEASETACQIEMARAIENVLLGGTDTVGRKEPPCKCSE